jgi:predicted nucleotidyltransferase
MTFFRDQDRASQNRRRLLAQLADIRRRLGGLNVQKAILFGSLARDEVTPFSDLDLLIVQDTDARFLDRLDPFYSELDLGVDADILVYTPGELERMQGNNPFIDRILQEGRVIYEAKTD